MLFSLAKIALFKRFATESGALTTSATNRDELGFYAALRTLLLTLLMLLCAVGSEMYARGRLEISWREDLTGRLLGSYFADGAFYGLKSEPVASI